MKKIRLRTFIILSLVFHIVLITALVAIFVPKRGILRNVQTPISVGILTQSNGIDKAKDTSLDSIARNVSIRKETPKNNPLEKKGMSQADDNEKTIKKIYHQKENTTPKKHATDIASVSSDSSAIETETVNNKIAFSDTDKETINQRTARLSGNENMNLKRDFGTESLSRNIERAFPDYKVNPKPRYPMLARRKGYEGTILLRVFVLESGGVGKVELEKSSGYEILDESALKAVKEWVFIPGKKDGEPVPSWVTVPIKFQLNSG
jgi:TonB family protein